LRGDNLSTTTACDPSNQNLVVAVSPMVANQGDIGSQVTLITCGRNVRVPSVVGDTVDQATAAIQSAGLVVGTISNTTSCDVTVGEIASATPKGGNLVLTGTTVNLKKSTGRPRNGCG
jgi:serine/threonine-protein kinase